MKKIKKVENEVKATTKGAKITRGMGGYTNYENRIPKSKGTQAFIFDGDKNIYNPKKGLPKKPKYNASYQLKQLDKALQQTSKKLDQVAKVLKEIKSMQVRE